MRCESCNPALRFKYSQLQFYHFPLDRKVDCLHQHLFNAIALAILSKFAANNRPESIEPVPINAIISRSLPVVRFAVLLWHNTWFIKPALSVRWPIYFKFPFPTTFDIRCLIKKKKEEEEDEEEEEEEEEEEDFEFHLLFFIVHSCLIKQRTRVARLSIISCYS